MGGGIFVPGWQSCVFWAAPGADTRKAGQPEHWPPMIETCHMRGSTVKPKTAAGGCRCGRTGQGARDTPGPHIGGRGPPARGIHLSALEGGAEGGRRVSQPRKQRPPSRPPSRARGRSGAPAPRDGAGGALRVLRSPRTSVQPSVTSGLGFPESKPDLAAKCKGPGRPLLGVAQYPRPRWLSIG